MSSSFKQGFPERWRNQLKIFSDEALNELTIDRRILAYEAVVTKLAEQVSTDLRVICEFGEPSVQKIERDGKTNLEVHLPINPTINHVLALTDELKKDRLETWERKKSGDPLAARWRMMQGTYLWNDELVQRFAAFLHWQHGEDAQDVANALCAWTEIDTSERLGQRIIFQNIPTFTDLEKAEISIQILWHYSPPEGAFGEKDIHALQHVTGFSLRNRLAQYSSFEEAIAVLERLIATSELVRHKSLLLLQNFRHKPHDYLVGSIATRGYETLLQMNAMSEWDMWANLQREQLRAAEDLAAKSAQPNEKAMAVKLNEGEPDVLRYLDDESARDIWRRASIYTSIHPEQPRFRLVDKIPCEEFRYQMDVLRFACQWEALAAKEREVVNHIFSEVLRIGYAHAEEQDRPYTEISFLTGNPSYALKHSRLNCFTGPWLIAALCLECGIPYERLFYCCVNEDSDNVNAGTHSALLMRYVDGSLGYIDYGQRKANRRLALAHIENPVESKHLNLLIDASSQWAAQSSPFKIVGDPVHISVNASVAKVNGLYRDVHVLPLDQGFSAIQLLHTGLSMKNEGNIDEALEAFELGLTFFPTSPDLLCQCAIIHYERADLQRAEWLLDLALSEYKNHLLSLFYKAKLLHIQGKIDEAADLFRRVEFDPREIWGDKSIKVQALRYGLKNQLEVVLPEAVKQLSGIFEGDGQSILTRCETHLL